MCDNLLFNRWITFSLCSAEVWPAEVPLIPVKHIKLTFKSNSVFFCSAPHVLSWKIIQKEDIYIIIYMFWFQLFIFFPHLSNLFLGSFPPYIYNYCTWVQIWGARTKGYEYFYFYSSTPQRQIFYFFFYLIITWVNVQI